MRALKLRLAIVPAGGAGIAGLPVQMMRSIPPQRQGLATGVVKAGGSIGQS